MLKSAPRFMITTHIPDCDCLFIRAHHDAAYIERTFLVIFLAVSAGRALTPMVRLDRYRQLALPYTSGSEPSSVLKIGQAVRLRYVRCIAGDEAMRYHKPNSLGNTSTWNPGDTLGSLEDASAHFPRFPAVYVELRPRGMPFSPFHLWPIFLRRPSWVWATLRGTPYALWGGLRSWRVPSSAIKRVTWERSE